MLRMPRDNALAERSAVDIETALRDFGHWIDKALEFVGNRYGIGVVDRSCLELLAARPQGSAPGEIAENLRLSVGEARALVSRLVRRGYARRERDPADPDRITVHAEFGNPDVMAIVRARRVLMDDLKRNFDPAEIEVIARHAAHVASIHPARLIEEIEREIAAGMDR
ncbi:MarR family transcriptional regulator [Oricola thermophila]|uniref:MarR family transcriptional regulator n=1 Tax=Oricola thermophila TaxID=2742145 RepID=A0A6N1VHH6_9HYPH|nr:helix-turn-helix domain-containing protein [Oricola thermophila]QKV20416.1 MarR family transcriptional regulator [Oricola thermophila]